MERAFFKKKERAEPAAIDETAVSEPLLSAWISGTNITREMALNVPAVAACINKIADTVASIPIKLYKKDGKEINEVEDDGRIFLLNSETGDTLDATQLKRAMIRDYYLGKGGYCFVNWRGNEVKSIHYVDEREVSFSEGVDIIFKEYSILVQGKIYFPYQFIRMLRNTRNGAFGTGIIEENDRILSVAYNTIAFEENLVKTGGNKKGFVKSAKRLSQAAIDALKEAWAKLYSNNNENVVILNDGLDFKEASNTSVEMQLSENKESNGKDIARILGIPPSMLYGTMNEQDDKAFIKYCINNVLDPLIEAINRAMLTEKEKGTYFFGADTAELTRGDIDKRYSAYKTGLESGFLQPDEVRAKENMEPLGLDFVKLGLQDVLYDPATKIIYTPNTNKSITMGGGENEGESNSEKNQSLLTDMSTQLEETAGQSRTEGEENS
ncbi:MAG: phage portal protein [Lachnospiraceae bacterium]